MFRVVGGVLVGVFTSTGQLGTGRGIYVGNYEDTACTALGNFVLVFRMAETSIGGSDRDNCIA